MEKLSFVLAKIAFSRDTVANYFAGASNKETVFSGEIHFYRDLLEIQLDYVSAETTINSAPIEGTILLLLISVFIKAEILCVTLLERS